MIKSRQIGSESGEKVLIFPRRTHRLNPYEVRKLWTAKRFVTSNIEYTSVCCGHLAGHVALYLVGSAKDTAGMYTHFISSLCNQSIGKSA